MSTTGPSSIHSAAAERARAAYPAEIAFLANDDHARVSDQADLRALMSRAAGVAVRLIDGVHWARVTVQCGGAPFSVSESDNAAPIVDESPGGDGPGLRALRTGHPVAMTVCQLGWSWPQLGLQAHNAGIGTVLAVPLRSAGEPTGSLTFYSTDRTDICATAPDLVVILRAYLDRGLGDYTAARLSVQLGEDLDNARIIECCVGALMAGSAHLDAAGAADVLASESRIRGEPLQRTARTVLAESTGHSTG